jgi:tetratricopeptide (TPR) repeat protein
LDEVAVQLAHHYRRGGDYSRACLYFSQAAENAARVYANDEAIAHYTQAIELAEDASLDVGSQAKLYHGRGLALETIGQFERARADHQAILKASRAAGERHLEWRALIDLGKLWASRDYDRTHQCFENALELARRMDEPAVLAGSLNWMGNWYLNTEDLLAAKAHHREALEIFERLGDRQGLAATLDLLGITNLLGGDAAAGVACYDRAIALFRELGDRPGLASSLTGRGHAGCATYSSLAMISSFTPKQARRDFEEAIRIARDIGSPASEAWALWSLGLLHMVQGQFGKGLEVTQRSLAIATDIGHREWIVGSHSILGSLYVEMLAPKQARVHLEQALVLAKELRSQHWIHQATGSLAAACRLLSDTAGAQTCLETVLSPDTSMDTLHKRYCWVRRAELALCQADPGLALDITGRLIATAPGMSPGRVIAFLWKLRGQALAALGQVDEALTLLEAALDNAEGLGERAFVWGMHVSLAQLYTAVNQQPEAEQALKAARTLIEELAATIPDQALKGNFRQRALGTIQSSS